MDPSEKKADSPGEDEASPADRTSPEPEEAASDGGPTKTADEPKDEGPVWPVIRDTYLTFDRRTLGFTRILVGFLFVMDLFRRTADWNWMFSTEGVLPNHVNLFRPQASQAFSLVNAFSTRGELVALWIIVFLTFVCLMVGYKTKLAQILSVVFVCSMDGRVLLIENGGYVVYNLLAMWTAFLPMGDRFSVDAMLASMKRRRERTADDLNDRTGMLLPEQTAPYVSLMGLVLLVQLSAIYYFNVIHKTGPAWKNGTAVHYVLYVDRMVTPLVAHVRDYIPNFLILFMTKTTLAFEAAIPVCLLSSLGKVWARRLAAAMMNALHIGFGFVFVLGPFAWALCTFSTLLFGTEDWDLAVATMKRRHRARVVLFDPGSPAALLLCRLLKRMDRFELLTFQAAEGLPTGIAVERGAKGSRARLTRALALADLVAALPIGAAYAWIVRLAGPRHAVDALMRASEGGRLSRFFGLELPTPAEAAKRGEPSPLRRKGWKAMHVLHELAVAAMFAGAVNQAMTELWCVNRRIKVGQPEPLRTLAHKLRFLQGWFMFSPNPVMDDGTIVVDAITVDGRHIDPFTGKEPSFDLINAKSLLHNQIWCDYFNRIHLPSNTAYRDAMKDFMYRLPERTGRPNDAIVSGEVFWVQDQNPKWNETQSYKQEKLKLFSFENREVKNEPRTPQPQARLPLPAASPAGAPREPVAPPPSPLSPPSLPSPPASEAPSPGLAGEESVQ